MSSRGYFKPDVEGDRDAIHERFNEHLSQRVAPVRLRGPLYDAAGRRSGVFLIVETKTFQIAEAFLTSSPYQQAGMYERTDVYELSTEVGSLR